MCTEAKPTTVRLDLEDTCKMNTDELLGTILTHVRNDLRVCFLCPPGNGGTVMQRVRVALSRVRTDMKRKGRPIAHFTLRNTVHPETHDARRFDAVVVWREVNQRHTMLETLEDIVERKVS